MSETESWTYKRKTPVELERLAWDVASGLVVGTWDNRVELFSFMVLALMGPDQLNALVKMGVAHVFEYVDKAGPRAVNGMPTFMSAQYIDHHDYADLRRRVTEIVKQRDERLRAAESQG